MKLTKSTIATTFAALLIGGMAVNPALAKVHYETDRVDTSEHTGFKLEGNGIYNTGLVASEGNAKTVFQSKSAGRTNGHQG